MKRRFAGLLVTFALIVLPHSTPGQTEDDEALKAAITIMRAINTAENAERQSTGRYVELRVLVDQRMMSRVRPDLVVSRSEISFRSQKLRVTASCCF